MPNFNAVKLTDFVVGVDVHPLAPGVPIHPYFGPIFLWHSPQFPKSNVFINGMPACTIGSMGYYLHIPQGAVPVEPTNAPYWFRYLTNVVMGVVLMGLSTLANIVIASISSIIPNKPACIDDFIGEVTGSTGATSQGWAMVGTSFSIFTSWQTWVQLLMPPIPFCGSQGSTALGNPKVTVNGSPLAIVCPLAATSCSMIPVVPNAMPLGFSNVMVGMSIDDLIKGLLVNAVKSGISAGIGAGVGKLSNKITGKLFCGCKK